MNISSQLQRAKPFFAVLMAMCASIALALPEGRYTSEGGQSTLIIQKIDKDGWQAFDINTVGTNAHLCDLSGKVKDGRFTEGEKSDAKSCTFQMVIDKDRLLHLKVDDQHKSACGSYCGSRTYFWGVYKQIPKLCGKSTKEKFLAHYRAKQYVQALSLLQSMQEQCGRWDHWSEVLARANDMAITFHHLNRRSDCISALSEFTKAGISKDSKDDREVTFNLIGAQPAFEDVALRQIQSARTNLKLCGYTFQK